MSKIIVVECDPTTVYQQIVADKNMFVVALRPHLYIEGSPAGTVKVQVLDTNNNVVAESSAQTITSLKTDTYAHKYIKFDVNANLRKDVSYRLAVVCGGGYVFNNTNFVGVCLDWDSPKVAASYSPNTGFNAALDFEIWERLTSCEF